MILKLADKGIAVNDLQRRLFYYGYRVPITGVFDKSTLEAIKTIQKRFGLVPSGIYDYRVNEILFDRSTAFFLKEKELLELATNYNIQPAIVAALVDVCGSKTFNESDKLNMVFERDVFYNLLKNSKHKVTQLSKLHPNIISQEKGGYLGGQAERLRLLKASAISTDLAAMSVGYGMFEIPGTAYQACSFDTVHDFVKALRSSEKKQVDIFLSYLDSMKLLEKLREYDFTQFAKAYDENYYYRLTDVALSRAYEFYAAIYPNVEIKENAQTD